MNRFSVPSFAASLAQCLRRGASVIPLAIIALALPACGGGGGSSTPPAPPPTVATVPGAPTNVSAAAGNTNARVSWSVPNNGGSAITQYNVTASPGGAAAIAAGGATFAIVPGLANGSSYTFTVFASNGVGRGPASALSNAVTPQAGLVSVAVTPTRTALTTSQRQRFTASVIGSSNTAVTWSVDGIAGGSASVGTIDGIGTYSPPSTGGRHTVAATSQADNTQSATASVAVTDMAGILTYQYDAQRTGQNLKEYALTPAVVADSTAFGKLFSCPVDAAVYAQPLYVPNLSIGGGVHNVLFVATENDTVYAFDADDPTKCGTPVSPYWYQSFLSTNVVPVPASEADSGPPFDLPGTMGITGTPVIDATHGVIYLVARTKHLSPSVSYVVQLHALNISTGAEMPNSPVTINPTYSGNGYNNTGTVPFDPLRQAQRTALLLLGNHVYVGFGSSSDIPYYNGWLLAFNTSTLQQDFVFNSTPSAPSGGPLPGGAFWMSGSGPAADSAGNIYIPSANGVFDNTASIVPPGAPSNDMADSLLKFNQNLVMLDFFTPSTQGSLQSADDDFGAGGLIVLPDSMGSVANLHLVMATDKTGDFWLVDRDSMGRYLKGSGGTDANLQRLPTVGGLFASPAIWNGHLYMGSSSSQVFAYPISDAHIGAAAFSTNDSFAARGTTPSISALNASDGILWALDTGANGSSASSPSILGPAILRAYDATRLGAALFDSSIGGSNTCGDAVKFTIPMVANGKVYVGGDHQVTVYGLKP